MSAAKSSTLGLPHPETAHRARATINRRRIPQNLAALALAGSGEEEEEKERQRNHRPDECTQGDHEAGNERPHACPTRCCDEEPYREAWQNDRRVEDDDHVPRPWPRRGFQPVRRQQVIVRERPQNSSSTTTPKAARNGFKNFMGGQ